MDLVTTVTYDPVRPLHQPPAVPHHAVDQSALLIAMLHARGDLTDAEAAHLTREPWAVDDIVMLIALRDRHDLSETDFRIEKASMLS